ncbi:hypothetical protein JI735_16300 [Paenibacillus sonchi]|uniref:Uncharacterized protein n=1 Tax=Paenibacillus sonchi TaxID=373687 RepID=A0A974SFT3_9BACL|nr:hypothetical protein JI735_16300 [Paenibacillus sonchi]
MEKGNLFFQKLRNPESEVEKVNLIIHGLAATVGHENQVKSECIFGKIVPWIRGRFNIGETSRNLI